MSPRRHQPSSRIQSHSKLTDSLLCVQLTIRLSLSGWALKHKLSALLGALRSIAIGIREAPFPHAHRPLTSDRPANRWIPRSDPIVGDQLVALLDVSSYHQSYSVPFEVADKMDVGPRTLGLGGSEGAERLYANIGAAQFGTDGERPGGAECTGRSGVLSGFHHGEKEGEVERTGGERQRENEKEKRDGE